MKIKNIIGSIFAAALTLSFSGCDSDMDHVTVKPGDDISLGGAGKDIILTPDNPKALALTLFWSGDGKLSLSDPDLQAPVNTAEETIELSIDEAFTTPYVVNVEKGKRERQFTNEELNSILGLMDFPIEELKPMYIRIATNLAPNVSPTYSNVLTVNVRAYRIHLNIGAVLDAGKNATEMWLSSPDENGIYTGFMGVGAWYNWWLRENNNVTWGNLGEDGKSFYISSEATSWNFWFPGESGCYYTTVNTVDGWWSALLVKELTVAGDIDGVMTYNQKANQWVFDIKSASAYTAHITISGKGVLYDKETTADGPGVEQNVAFGGNCLALDFGQSATNITIDIPAGETTLILDLNNPDGFTLTTGTAAEEPETSDKLYFSGLVTWDGFDDYLTLYDEASLSYGGAHYIDSEWGYRAYPTPDWSAAFKAADDATALSGALITADSDGNIPAPEKGLYVMDFSLMNLNYSLTKVESVTFAGLNDNWTETEMTQSTENPEAYVAEFVKEKETPWGVKVLINHDWSLFFGGASGVLKLGHSDATGGFDGDNDLAVGDTYILTIDLGTQTYSYTKK